MPTPWHLSPGAAAVKPGRDHEQDAGQALRKEGAAALVAKLGKGNQISEPGGPL